MELKKYLLCFLIPSVFGATIFDRHDIETVKMIPENADLNTFDARELSEEEVMPLMSNNPIPEALKKNTLTLILLQFVRKIFQVATQMGIAEQGWRFSSGFMRILMSVLFGPDVDVYIPVLTSVGSVVLRWLT